MELGSWLTSQFHSYLTCPLRLPLSLSSPTLFFSHFLPITHFNLHSLFLIIAFLFPQSHTPLASLFCHLSVELGLNLAKYICTQAVRKSRKTEMKMILAYYLICLLTVVWRVRGSLIILWPICSLDLAWTIHYCSPTVFRSSIFSPLHRLTQTHPFLFSTTVPHFSPIFSSQWEEAQQTGSSG